MPWITLAKLAEESSFSVRSLQYIRKGEPGVLITREAKHGTEYKQPDCVANLLKRERDLAKKEASPTDAKESQARKLAAEALLLEIELQQKRGTVIPTTVHERVVGEMADRVRAVLINVPSTYMLDLERAGVDAATAEQVLRDMAEALTRALRGVAEEDDADRSD